MIGRWPSIRGLRSVGLSVTLALMLALSARAAESDRAPSTPPAPPPAASTGELTRSQAIALVQRRYHARVVRTQLTEQQGRRVYVFKLLSSGSHVWSVRIDARTGEQLQP